MTTKPGVLQTWPSSPILREALESKFQFFALWEQKDEAAFFREKGHLIRGIVATGGGAVRITESLVSRLPNLEVVAAFSVGIDFVDTQPLKSRGLPVTNTPDLLTEVVAESAVMLLIAVMRRLVFADRYVRDGRWMKEPGSRHYYVTRQLSGKRVGIIGLGRIGAATAKRLEGFSCSIGYWGRAAKPEFPAYKFYADVVDLARHSDALIAACSLTDGTRGIVNREVLDALGPEGYVVNVARGAVFDEKELVKALVEKRIGGAGLDVFEKEPYVPEELFQLESVVLQPHLAAGSVETLIAMTDLVVKNLEAQFAGRPLLTPIAI